MPDNRKTIELRLTGRDDGATRVTQQVGAGVLKMAAGFLSANAVMGAVRRTLEFTRDGLSRVIDERKVQAQFGILLGNMDRASGRVRELRRQSLDSPFEFADLAAASRQLETMTGGLLATGDGLQMVIDTAAGTGRSLKEVAQAVGLFYTNLKAGNASGERAMMQLKTMGIFTGDLLRRLREMAAGGASPAAIWEAALPALQRYAGAAARVESADPADRLADEWTKAKLALADAAMPALAKAAGALANELERLMQTGKIDKWGRQAAEGISQLAAGLHDMVEFVKRNEKWLWLAGGAFAAGKLRGAATKMLGGAAAVGGAAAAAGEGAAAAGVTGAAATAASTATKASRVMQIPYSAAAAGVTGAAAVGRAATAAGKGAAAAGVTGAAAVGRAATAAGKGAAAAAGVTGAAAVGRAATAASTATTAGRVMQLPYSAGIVKALPAATQLKIGARVLPKALGPWAMLGMVGWDIGQELGKNSAESTDLQQGTMAQIKRNARQQWLARHGTEAGFEDHWRSALRVRRERGNAQARAQGSTPQAAPAGNGLPTVNEGLVKRAKGTSKRLAAMRAKAEADVQDAKERLAEFDAGVASDQKRRDLERGWEAQDRAADNARAQADADRGAIQTDRDKYGEQQGLTKDERDREDLEFAMRRARMTPAEIARDQRKYRKQEKDEAARRRRLSRIADRERRGLHITNRGRTQLEADRKARQLLQFEEDRRKREHGEAMGRQQIEDNRRGALEALDKRQQDADRGKLEEEADRRQHVLDQINGGADELGRATEGYTGGNAGADPVLQALAKIEQVLVDIKGNTDESFQVVDED